MAFTLKNYIKRGLIAAVGKMADYQIILNSAGWMEKGVLDETDLMDIQTAIDAQYVVEETETPIEMPETTTEERLQDAETALGIMFGEAQ